jgi:hypothetical protein
MRGSAKKTNSREAFAAVFEEQTRRFSAFELLGLSADRPPPPQQSSDESEASIGPASKPITPEDSSKAEVLRTHRKTQALIPNPQVEEHRPDGQKQEPKDDSKAEVLRTHRKTQALIPNPQVEGLVQYGPTQALTVDPQRLGPTVGSDLGLTTIQHRPDRQAQDAPTSNAPKLLAPLQWAVWCALQNAETAGRITSYRQIAKETNATSDGVKKAVNVIQKEGGIIKKEVIRSAAEQGFRVKLNHEILFRAATLNETKGVLKRGLYLGQTGEGRVQELRPDGLRMYVCKNINIKQTDVAALLRIPPVTWKLREQTLIQIADTLPDMTAIEFRLSLNYLVEQEKNAKEPIRNHNAWVKATFEKNKGPLVTEREIEVRFEQSALKRELQKPAKSTVDHNDDSELLRLYFACTPEERMQIDLMAEEKAAPLLKIVSDDKRAGVLEEARREAARMLLAKQS